MNVGQLRLEVERLCRDETIVAGINRVDGTVVGPAEIGARIAEFATTA